MFITLEDETGPVNVIVRASLFDKYRRLVLIAGIMSVKGLLQREGQGRRIVAGYCPVR